MTASQLCPSSFVPKRVDDLSGMCVVLVMSQSYLFEPLFEAIQLVPLDHQMLVVEVLHDVVVVLLIDLQDDGLDGRITLHKYA